MENDKSEWLKPFERKFVDGRFAITDPDSLKRWFDTLMERKLETSKELIGWLADYSELMAIISEDSNKRYVDMTCDTKDESKKESYLRFVREFQPKITEWSNLLDKKYYSSQARQKLDAKEHGRLDRMISTSIELFDEKNILLDVKLSEMSQKYQSTTGAWVVEFDGKTRTMPQMQLYQLKADRELRESAWNAVSKRRLADAKPLENLFDEMLKTRSEYAQNLGLKDYREYCFKAKLRDYTPDDCFSFHDAIEKSVVPLVAKIALKRKEQMKLDNLKPWDMQVDPLGREPLHPFKEVSELQDGVEKIFGKINPKLGERFASIKQYMDLESRDGKAPGGYQTTFEERRIPFIFTNAAGMHSDVITLLHEGGHAFHTIECRNHSLIWYRHATMEFSEVASMSQELFANRHLDIFYGSKEVADRARLEQLERVVDIFPWVATIDAFQHWLYTAPGHSQEERAEKWLEISSRFEVKLNWEGINRDIKKYAWHRQLHLFEVPFYYIEYAIAQLGALQFYKKYKENPAKAVEDYLGALSLGGSSACDKLFEAGGIKFDFSENMLRPLMEMVEEEIETFWQ